MSLALFWGVVVSFYSALILASATFHLCFPPFNFLLSFITIISLNLLIIAENDDIALENARKYFRRLQKWDGIEENCEREIFGHDIRKVKEMSQVDVFSEEEEW